MIAQVNLPIFAKNGRNNLAQDPYALQQYLTSLLQPIDRNVHDMFTKEQSFILAADYSDATLVFQIGALCHGYRLTSSTSFIVPIMTDETDPCSSEVDILTSLDIDSGNVPSPEPI